MSYITEIFERLDIQQIREFLLHGVECVEISEKSYKRRLEESSRPAYDIIKSKFPDMKEYDKITSEMSQHDSVTQDVYMEIGLQCGAALAVQLLINPHKE